MLNQTVGYAVTALAHVASLDKPILVRDIASAVGIPGPYLAKLINILSRKGFVATQRGIGGGVLLARSPNQVSLYDLCEALDDPIVQERCMLSTMQCSNEEPCALHDFWKSHRDSELKFLKDTKLSDMVSFQNIPKKPR